MFQQISLVISLSFISSLYATELKCKNYNIKYTMQKAEVFENNFLCLKFKDGTLLSKNCKNGECIDIKNSKDNSDLLKGYKRNIGTKGFHVCHKIGGKPRIIKVQKVNNRWQTFDQCILKDGFMDTTTLLEKLNLL